MAGSHSKGRTLLAASAIGIVGYGFGAVVVGLAGLVLLGLGIPLLDRPLLLVGLSTVLGQGVAFAGFALAYLRYTGRGFGFVHARMPTLRDLGWTVGGTVAMLAGLVVLSAVLAQFGIESASNTVVQFGEQDPRAFLLLVVLSFLLIGPGEELLYRGVVQGRLRESFGPWVAIVVASVVFAVIHVFSLQGTGKLTYLALLVVLSLILGVAYERTDNILVPALVHGAFNAVQFFAAYLNATRNLGTGLL